MPVELAASPEEIARYEAMKAEAAAMTAAARAKREAAELQAAQEKAEAEEAELRAKLMPGWLLANPAANESDFRRLWPLIKAQDEAHRRRAMYDAALTTKTAGADYFIV
jgi:hypothetical protein